MFRCEDKWTLFQCLITWSFWLMTQPPVLKCKNQKYKMFSPAGESCKDFLKDVLIWVTCMSALDVKRFQSCWPNVLMPILSHWITVTGLTLFSKSWPPSCSAIWDLSPIILLSPPDPKCCLTENGDRFWKLESKKRNKIMWQSFLLWIQCYSVKTCLTCSKAVIPVESPTQFFFFSLTWRLNARFKKKRLPPHWDPGLLVFIRQIKPDVIWQWSRTLQSTSRYLFKNI